MPDSKEQVIEKTLESKPTLELEINAARINALELKLETLSLITEALWEVIQTHNLEQGIDLKDKIADIIDQRAQRDALTTQCPSCNSEQKASSAYCNNCGTKLDYKGDISPFDY